MENCEFVMDVNWMAVLLAALAAFFIGSFWYLKPFFGKIWIEGHELKEDHTKGAHMPTTFGLTFLSFIIGALFFDLLLANLFSEISILHGLMMGIFVGLGFIATSFAVSYLFLRKSLKVWLVDSMYYIFCYGIMGIVLSIWR